jgi:hypothetical protein
MRQEFRERYSALPPGERQGRGATCKHRASGVITGDRASQGWEAMGRSRPG